MKTTNKIIIIFFFFSVIFFSSCTDFGENTVVTKTNNTPCDSIPSYREGKLQGIVWKFESFEDSSGTITLPIKSQTLPCTKYEITFHTNDTIDGYISCNSVVGKFAVIDDSTIIIDKKFTTTLTGCEEETISTEEKLYSGLRNVSSYKITGNKLHLYYNQKKNILNFIAKSLANN